MARGILVALLLVSCLYVAYGWGPDVRHNLTVGRKGPNDWFLYKRNVFKSNGNRWGFVTEDVTFSLKEKPFYKPIITEIDAIDLVGYGRGGFARIIKGGVGRNNVTIHFRSQQGRGFKFNLTIYGRNKLLPISNYY